MAGHRPPKPVRTPRPHPRDVHRDLDDLLLVEDHPERVLEDRLEQRMGVRHRLAALLAPYVGMDGVALDRSRTDDRHLHHQVVECLGARARQCLHLRPRLDLEHADGVRIAAHLVDRRVGERQLVEIGPDSRRVLDQVQRLGDHRQRAQAEHVHLDQAQVLDVVLVELDDPPPFHGCRLDRGDVDQRLSGDQHSSVVDREVARKLDHLAAQLEELPPALRPHFGRWHRPLHRILDVLGEPPVDALGEAVEELGRESQRLADLPDRHPRLERDHVADHPGPLPAVLLVDVLDHLLAVLGREIDVDVRRARHLLVQEALEKEVVLDRVDAGYAQHVGDDRVRGRATALPWNAVLAGEAHQVPVDEEELGQPGLLDHLELVLQAMGHRRGDRPVALAQAFEAQLVEKGEGRLAGGNRIAREPDLAEVEVEVALLRDLPRRGQGGRVVVEQLAHLGAAFQVVLGVGEEVRAHLVERRAVPNRNQRVVELSPRGDVVVDLVGGHHRRAAATRHRRPSLEDP